jgi:D-specific alpha-keto acid dehydrogenase
MIRSEPAPPVVGDPAATLAITVYGCAADEAALFRRLAPRLGVAATLTEADLSLDNVDLAIGTRCISVGHKARIDHRTLEALARAGVAYVSTRSIGCNHIDMADAERVGITVENVAYSPDSVADYTLMLILMALRHARTIMRRSDAHDYRLHHVPGRELRDLTVGVIGTGRIGGAVVDRLRGFGCRIVTHDRRATPPAEHLPLGDLLALSDVVTLHTPLTADTHHLLDGGRFAQMKPGAIVVNTGRGSLVDTEALVAALEGGRLGGAALDVLEGEEGIFYADCRPRPVEHPLLLRLHRLPNVVLSPHTAYHTDHALSDIVANSIRNCRAYLDA